MIWGRIGRALVRPQNEDAAMYGNAWFWLMVMVAVIVFVSVVFGKGHAGERVGKVCRNCGASHPGFAQFCRRCGQRLSG
jgi:hypothetical protein